MNTASNIDEYRLAIVKIDKIGLIRLFCSPKPSSLQLKKSDFEIFKIWKQKKSSDKPTAFFIQNLKFI
jgi:hypothetical protein